ncbi:LegC family aminotransferase [Salinispira pacifica]|uniref:GDP-perosamine synthase n=1 Tax=Salinispira pacifica TaxID=1307761 RepID=V5WMS3_9SPIO|nr:LegC family aminotransferase [Salinispira pacifica]AHC16491.1 Putative aminotransferase [Salinispira pacifica]
MNANTDAVIDVIRGRHGKSGFIPLHAPVFLGNEKKYLNECIDSTFVSSVGKYVDRFEEMVAEFTGARKAVAVVNGTNGLHLALRLVGVEVGDEVITQALTFVATTNAIHYAHAHPVFVDVDRDTMGMSPESLEEFLAAQCIRQDGFVKNKTTGRKVSAVMPMHTFGHPARITEIVGICKEWGIPVVEDAAESLGSYDNGQHTGTFGEVAVFSFNGNKTITTGGGGMIVTNNEELGNTAKHLSTTAKVPSSWEFFHDDIGYNYRLPNLNAALGCAQMEKLPEILKNKKETAEYYRQNLSELKGLEFFSPRQGVAVNNWLNAVVLESKNERDRFLKITNEAGIQTRPIWVLQNKLPMNSAAQADNLENSLWLEDRVVNIPSSVVL